MSIITLIFILVTAYSDKPVTLTPHPLCTNPKAINYPVDEAIMCIGSGIVDTIFKGGFE